MVATGETPLISFEKMSKSKYNGVDPDVSNQILSVNALLIYCIKTVVKECGVDPTRLHILYKAPPSEVLEWEDASIIGMQRWLAKVLKLSQSIPADSCNQMPTLDTMSNAEREMYRVTNQTIKQVTETMSSTYSFNTAISDLIKLSNHITSASSQVQSSSAVYQHAVKALVKMMAPMTPTVSEECWEIASNSQGSVFDQSWPALDAQALEKNEIDCIVQVIAN
jgi:leucyl-tRNA synthetase